MVDLPPQQELRDSLGSSTMFTGTVGTIATNVPPSASTSITELFVRCPNQTPNTKTLSFSIDGGTNFFVLYPGESILWPLKGAVTQVSIKGSVAGVSYEILINRDQTGEI